MVRNIHERNFRSSPQEVGDLINRLASDNDILWPGDRWPPMRFDRPLQVGAEGGHGPIRYYIESYQPYKNIKFRFTSPKGFNGTHEFIVEEHSSEVTLRHVILMEVEGRAKYTWMFIIRWLHDALIEEAFDRVEAYLTKKSYKPRRMSLWVRILRYIAKRN